VDNKQRAIEYVDTLITKIEGEEREEMILMDMKRYMVRELEKIRARIWVI